MSGYRDVGFEVISVLDEPEDLKEMLQRIPEFGFAYDEIKEEAVRFTENSVVAFNNRGELRVRCWGDIDDAKKVSDETLKALTKTGLRIKQEPIYIVGRELTSSLSLKGLVKFIKDELPSIVKKGHVRNTIETEIRDGGMIKITLENMQDWILEKPETTSIVRITVWAPFKEIEELSSKLGKVF